MVVEAHRCEDLTSTTCTLKGISFDDEHPGRFIPKSNVAQNVTKVTFTSSTIPILTSDICDNFPNVETLQLIKVSLKVVKSGAFNYIVRNSKKSNWQTTP